MEKDRIVWLRTAKSQKQPGQQLPNALVQAMYVDYLEIRSTRKLAVCWGCTNSEIEGIFKRAGLPLKSRRLSTKDFSGVTPEHIAELLNSIEWWITWTAHKIAGNNSNFDDVAQAGRLYAIQSVPDYDAEKYSASFLNFIRTNCRRAMCRAAAQCSRVIRVPSREWQNVKVTTLSLETPTGHDDGSTIGDTALRTEETVTAAVVDNEVARRVSDAIDELKPRYRDVVRLYYLQGKSGDEVGSALGITRQRVFQILEIAFSKLRKSDHLEAIFDC